MFHGPHGDNGKTTFIEVIRKMLGEDYSKVVPISILTRRGTESERLHEIADLYGKRFATASEPNEGEMLDESFIKSSTGRGRLHGRRIYKSAFDYDPMFKLFIEGNHKLGITGSDPAIWRRIRMIPFEVSIPKDRQDKHLDAKLHAELPGILAWAVRGAVAFAEHGLGEPSAVRDATDTYQSEQDIIHQLSRNAVWWMSRRRRWSPFYTTLT